MADIKWESQSSFLSGLTEELLGEPGEYWAEAGPLTLRVKYDSPKQLWRGTSNVSVFSSGSTSAEAKEKLVAAIRSYAQSLLDALS